MIRRILRALGSAIGLTILMALAVSLAVWFLGGFLGFGEARPFASVLGRVIAITVTWILALIVILIVLVTRSRRDTALADDMTEMVEPAAAANDGVVMAELGEMRAKLKRAMTLLRRSKAGRRHLYDLPWYVIIGPPGAGKTTAIVNSGLNFPLADEMGSGPIGGVGGTRNCDWWFTDKAVLVDTAGRYTTQESDAQADNAAWLGFLKLLKKHRTRQPINGAVVAISLSDLSMQDEITQKSHAAAIRRRLHELRAQLGVRFPVYVLFTKADLIAGFAEFFEPLGKEARGQVWGMTLPLQDGEVSPVAAFDAEYALLLQRLNSQSLDRIQAETDPARRALVAGFPQQLASIRPVAKTFLTELFQDNSFEHGQMLRGIYFTSGTQEGTPIDRLMMGMARSFGIGRQAIGSGRGTGRSYFLTQLFDSVMFPEAGLVSADDRVEFRHRWTKRAAVAASILAVAGAGWVWWQSFVGNSALLAATTQKIEAYSAAAAAIPGSPVGDTDLPLIVPALNTLSELAVAPVESAGLDPDVLGWGLSRENVVANGARQAYRAALNQHLLPRLLLRLEEQMQSNLNSPDFLYEALKIYLSLGLVGPMNTDLVRDWMQIDWELAYPGPSRVALRDDLSRHLDALLAAPMETIDLNSDLVAAVQDILTRMPQAERVYASILNSVEATSLPPFRLTDVGGPAITRALVRSSGKPLNDGIEGIFTYRGFNTVFLEQALTVATRIQRDAWVLGQDMSTDQNVLALQAISRDVLDLYYNDFISRYDQLLGDIDIVPMTSLSHAVEVTNVLSGPTSPIRNVLTAIATETDLTAQPTEPGAESGLNDAATAIAQAEFRRQAGFRAQLMAGAIGGSAGETQPEPGEYVTERFAWLHDLVNGVDGAPAPLDEVIGRLTEVYQTLNRAAFAGGATGSAGEAEALAQFQAVAQRIPGPMQRWAQQITVGSSDIAAEGTRARLNADWQSQVLPMCQQVVGDAYPFNRRSAADVSLTDFAALFGKGGLIDTFFTQNLAKHVDTRTRPWTFKADGGADLGISPAVLAEFQRAIQIRDAFFPSGQQPQVSFQITPFSLGDGVRGVVLEIDGQQIEFRKRDRETRPSAIRWPGSVGLAQVSLQPDRNNSESTLQRTGPWALFRLLDAAEVRPLNAADRKRVVFYIGQRIAMFDMQSGSVNDPFALASLAQFRCPASL